MLASAVSGLGGALRAPLGPVVAALVPRYPLRAASRASGLTALLPAPTPRLMGLRPLRNFLAAESWCRGELGPVVGVASAGMSLVPSADSTYAGGGGGKGCEARQERSND